MKVSIIGTGIYGLALALNISKNAKEVWMWTESDKVYDEWKKTKNLKSIIDVKLSSKIHVSKSYQTVLDNTTLIVIASSSKFVDIICKDMKEFYDKSIPICVATKGIEDSTEDLLTNIVKKILKTKNVSVISGPTFAVDIAHNEAVALALGSENKKTAKTVMKCLSTDRLKLRPTDDMLGIQICGTVKNIIAIASGILAGLGYTDSTRAFLVNESMHDIKNIIYYLGGNPKTILSFAGIGDLMLTCTSIKSRNYSFGKVIGSTKNPKEIKKFLCDHTVEGYFALNTVYKLLHKKNINIPLIDLIYDIVYNEKDPESLIQFLIEKE